MPLIPIDQRIGGRVMRRHEPLALELRLDLLRQLLAELDSPLVETEDIPDDPLHENLVLVEGYQYPERMRRQLGKNEGARRSIAGERLVRNELFDALGG